MTAQSDSAISIDHFNSITKTIHQELQKVIVGQDDLIHDLIVTMLAEGNALLEGVPGLGKTLLIRTLSQILDCTFNRIQFTPDLMPADITGTMIISENEEGKRGFRFESGPIFANVVLADEINRAAPRTQSALLEAMQEHNVTIAGMTHALPNPFYVLATQNPIEMEGTYPLPEAQLDRFLYKIEVPYPSENELVEIAQRTTGVVTTEIKKVSNGKILTQMQQLARSVPVEKRVIQYAARLVEATHPQNAQAPEKVKRNLRVGVSPRGIQAMVRAGKVEALMDNRKAVSIEDIRKVMYPSLNHRLIMNFEAQADGVKPISILDEIKKAVPVP